MKTIIFAIVCALTLTACPSATLEKATKPNLEFVVKVLTMLTGEDKVVSPQEEQEPSK